MASPSAISTTGVTAHAPGRLSRWGVVDVGLKCAHSCAFCYYSYLDGSDDQFAGMRHAKFLPRGHVLGLVDALAQNGFIGFDVTGGEPALHPDIVGIVERARNHGIAARVITLGQYLMRPMKSAGGRVLLDALVDGGIADFLLSVHAVDEAEFARITGGSWAKLKGAMDALDGRGFDYCTNTTVYEGNFHLLPEIAREIARHRVYVSNFIVMNAYYAWSRPGGPAGRVQGHYGELRRYLIEARDILEEAGVAVNFRYAPLCTMKGAERNLVGIVGVRYDPHEWMNRIDHSHPGDAAEMGMRLPLRDGQHAAPLKPVADDGIVARRAGKVFPAKCRNCAAVHVCDGIDPRYLAERGDGELEPYATFRGDLLDHERRAYLPGFLVKTEPFADMRGAMRALLKGSHVAAA